MNGVNSLTNTIPLRNTTASSINIKKLSLFLFLGFTTVSRAQESLHVTLISDDHDERYEAVFLSYLFAFILLAGLFLGERR